jgi:hypothetical protein
MICKGIFLVPSISMQFSNHDFFICWFMYSGAREYDACDVTLSYSAYPHRAIMITSSPGVDTHSE